MKKLIEIEFLKDFHSIKKGEKTTKYSKDLVAILIKDGIAKLAEKESKPKKEKSK